MQPQEKVTRAFRIDGSIVLYRLAAARSLSLAERPLLGARRSMKKKFAAPLFLRTLLRLVFLCPHRHKGPPMTLRESIPSNLPGCQSVYRPGSYITCLDCGQKFAYNHKTMRLVDFWGVRDAEALAGVRRKVDGFFSHFRGFAARIGRLNVGNPVTELVRPVRSLATSTKGQSTESPGLTANKWEYRSGLQGTQPRPGNN